ncbi:MAG TPA: hypothetical protein VII87_04265 [Solirubrobacteraceae bacterium]
MRELQLQFQLQLVEQLQQLDRVEHTKHHSHRRELGIGDDLRGGLHVRGPRL